MFFKNQKYKIYIKDLQQIHNLSALVVSSSGSSSAGPGQRREGRRALRPLLLRVFGQTFQVQSGRFGHGELILRRWFFMFLYVFVL